MPTVSDYLDYPVIGLYGGYTTIRQQAVHAGVVGGLTAPGLAGVAIGAAGSLVGAAPKGGVMPNGMAVVGAVKVAHRVKREISKHFHRHHGAKQQAHPATDASFGQRALERGKQVVGAVVGALPGGAPQMPGGGMMGGPMGGMIGGSPGIRGHWTKAHGHVPSHWSPRRRPRMHATNPRALRRAMRRMESFGRLAHRYVQLHHHHHFRKKPLKRKVA